MKKRTDINQPGQLSHSPFGALGKMVPEDLPDSPTPPEPPAAEPQSAWQVGKTRKGGYAISLENRPGGKHATVLKNVSGDAAALLKDLRKRCGAGGVAREDSIELQGDHQAALKAFLEQHR